MKILTIWQPWASLIALGLKEYETRLWGTDYRGKLLIHAAKRPVDTEGLNLWNKLVKTQVQEDLPLGRVVAIADLVNCQVINKREDGYSGAKRIYIDSVSELEKSVGLWESGRFAWKLANIQVVTPSIPAVGRQGLVAAPEELIRECEKSLCY